jgi:DNA-binding NtrC family response regulator
MAEVEALVGRMVEKHALVREVAALRAQLAVARPADLDFVTEYAPLRAVIAAADRAAPAGSPMLVSGEPGTGKLLLASRVHQASGRGGRPAVLECRGAAEADVMQPLRGAGTLVLRHVDALPAGAQRSLAEQLAGGAGARVVATVDGDPALRVAGGALTARLADCLAGVSVALPPLRERPGDVRPLVEHVLRALGAPGRVQMTVSALDALDAEPWPGNVPELRAVVLAAAARATDGLIDVPHLLRGAQVAG